MKGLSIKYNPDKIRALAAVALTCLYIFCQQFLPNIFRYMILVGIFVMFTYRKQFKFTIRQSHAAIIVSFLLFGGYMLLGTTWAKAPHTTFATSVLTLFTLLIGLAAMNQREFFRLLVPAILVCTGLEAIGMFMPLFSPSLYFSILSRLPVETYKNAVAFLAIGRLCGFNSQTAIAGFYMSVGIGIVLNILLFGNSRKKMRIIYWLILVVEVIALIMTFKRSGMLCVVLASIVILVLNKKIKALSVIKYGVLILILGIIALQYIKEIPEVNESMEQSIDRFDNKGGGDITSGRGELADRAIAIFERDPMLGIGFGGFGLDSDKGTHNVYLQVLCEGGIIGLLLYIPLVVLNLLKVMSSIRRKDGNMMLLNFSLFIQLYYIIYSAVGNCLTDNFIFLLYVLSAVVPYAVSSNKKVKSFESGLYNLLPRR